MSIDGLSVGTTSSATSEPEAAQRVRMSLLLEPMPSWSTGRPVRSATHPAKMLPKLRSEAHTSELQSLMRISYAVFCLKKKDPHLRHHATQSEQKTQTHTTQ